MSENIAIGWSDLTVSVRSLLAENDKIILNNICGMFSFNSINALMGSSGSGKTTLLKCLNENNNKYHFSDDSNVWVPKDMKITKCFIYQNHDQRVMTGLTIRQALTYASKLKNSGESDVNHNEIVSQVMSDLMISDVADNLIEKCSGGQIKRFCIAGELTSVIKPNLLLVDEPTTGLDSNAAELMIGCLKRLSRCHRMSIITSIHQPSNDLFQMFDSVYVLAKGGVCLYTGLPQNLDQHLHECHIDGTDSHIPIEAIIKLSFNGLHDSSVQQLANKTNEWRLDTRTLQKRENSRKTKQKTFKPIDFWYLLIRSLYRNYVSQPKSLLKTFLLFSVLTLFIVNCFTASVSDVDGCMTGNASKSIISCIKLINDKQVILQNENLLYFSYIMLILILIVLQTISFVNDLVIFRTENGNCWYSSGSFWCSKFVANTLLMLIYSIISFSIIQWSRPQFHDPYKQCLLFAIIFISYNIINCLASIIGTILCKNKNLAVVLSLFVIISMSTYDNFFLRVSDLPKFMQIISETAFLKYYINCIITLVYGLGRCSGGQQSRVLIEYGLVDDEYMFWKYFYFFLIYYTIVVIIDLTILIHWKSINQLTSRQLSTMINLYYKNIKQRTNTASHHVETSSSVECNLAKHVPDNPNNTRDITIAWIDLTYVIKKINIFGNHSCVQILDNISGYLESNTLNAIMGPSGAGKTTLLKCLSARKLNGLTETSRIMVSNGRNSSTFITQNILDHLLEGLTVRQTLLYASRLKNSRLILDLDHNQIVSDLMSELLIADTAENRVDHCSGGEQKRVAIASELTTYIKPKFLFIDEPTSGLDSNAAEVVISCLKSLSVSHSISIITTIHQPNNDLFQMFDKIYVLSKGGLNVYSGPPNNLVQHLNDCQIVCHRNQVPIEVLLKISSEVTKSESISRLVEKTNAENELLSKQCLAQNMRSLKSNPSKRFSFNDFYHLMGRTMIYTYKYQGKTFVLQFLVIQFFALIIKYITTSDITKPDACVDLQFDSGCSESLIDINDEKLIKQNLKYIMLLMTIVSIITLVVFSITYCKDYKIFRNEQQNGWYSTGLFLLVKTLVDSLPQIVIIAIFCWISDFYNSVKIYSVAFSMNLLILICTQSVTQISATISPDNTKLSLLIAIIIDMVILFLSNSVVPLRELHYSLHILSSISYIKYGFESVILIIYGFNRCTEDEISSVLYTYQIETQDFWSNIINMVIVCCLFKFLAFLTLIIRTNISFDAEQVDNSNQNNHQDNHCESVSLKNFII